jgi:hypothetical protein
MVIWTGYGILTVVFVVAGLLAGDAVDLSMQGSLGGAPPKIGMAVAVALAAILNWVVGTRLNTDPGRELVDAQTGQRVLLRRRHTLFWVPMQYWSLLVLVLAVALLFSAGDRPGTPV